MNDFEVTHLSPEQVEAITGIPSTRPRDQRRILKKNRIHCYINERDEVIVNPTWLRDAYKPVPRSFVAAVHTQIEAPVHTVDRKFCEPNFAVFKHVRSR